MYDEADPGERMPLHGIRVLDFTQTLSGPYATWLLASLGAEVVKVEPPGGDYLRGVKGGTMFAATNRGKRSIEIDLRSDEGRALALELSAGFDVVVESFKPGVMDRFGLSYDAVRERNPSVVYASISGFGQDGPYASRPGYDVIAQALSGIMAATGEFDRGPIRIGTGAIDIGTGVYAALAVVAALLRRRNTGLGSRIDANLLESAMSLLGHAYAHYSVTGESQIRRGTANESFVPYELFEASDGPVFVGVGTDRMWQSFCAEFGLDALGADARFDTIAGRVAHRVEVVARVADALRGIPAKEIVARLVAIGVPTAEVLPVEGTMRNEQVVARGILQPIDDPQFGRMDVMVFPVVMDDVPRVAGTPAPVSGADTESVVGELGRVRG